MPGGGNSGFLRRRNALWARLRAAPEGSAEFEALLTELCALTGWPRERVLAGLGLASDGGEAQPGR